MPKTNHNKLYTLSITDQGTKGYKHFRLSLGKTYSGDYFSSAGCFVTFQSNVDKAYESDNLLPYAGTVECRLECKELMPVITKAFAKGETLNPTGENKWDQLIIGLRAMGYKQAHVDRDYSQSDIWNID